MDIKPTPLTRLDSPYLDLTVTLPGNEAYYIFAGKNQGVPQIWELDSLICTLICDATVANRYIYARVYSDLGLGLLIGVQSPAVLASTTKTLVIGPYMYMSGAVVPGDFIAGVKPIVISGDNVLKIYIGSGQAGDTYTAHLRLKYLNYELGIQTPYDPLRKGG